MSVIINRVLENFNYVFYELNDDRTRDFWPNATTIFSIVVAYVYFVKIAGPAWMKDRKPYELKSTIIVYNVFQIIASFYIFCGAIHMWITDYNMTCQPVDNSNNPFNKKVHFLFWMYMTMKLIDLLDTVFFVLRKKDRQISALHLYHHVTMAYASWTGLKYFPNGHGTLVGIINCLVHTVMYTYYLIAGLGPQYQKYLWWKKHLTSMQLLQFVIIFFHNVYPLFIGCNYPKWINVLLALNSIIFIYMFGDFYYVNYIRNQSNHKKHKKQNSI